MIKVEKEYPLFKSKFQFQGIITTCCFVLQNVLSTMKKYFIAIFHSIQISMYRK